MKLRILMASTMALAVALAGCSSAKVDNTGRGADPAQEYAREKAALETSKVVSPGFLLRITHSADESISGEYRVNFKGELKLPYKVKVTAAGLTLDQLENRLAKAYSSYFKTRNTVNVEIVAREFSIELRGLVKSPGMYTVKLDTSIEEVIAQAGGLVPAGGEGSGKPEYLRIVRRDPANPEKAPAIRWVRLTDYFLKFDVKNEVLWRGGEQLFFQVTGDEQAIKAQGQTIQILGEVKKPGEYAVQPSTSLFTYLTQAGGHLSSADLTSVTVIRKANNDSDTYDITDRAAVVDLKPGDVILVKAINTRPGFFERMGPIFISIGSLALSVLIAVLTL